MADWAPDLVKKVLQQPRQRLFRGQQVLFDACGRKLSGPVDIVNGKDDCVCGMEGGAGIWSELWHRTDEGV